MKSSPLALQPPGNETKEASGETEPAVLMMLCSIKKDSAGALHLDRKFFASGLVPKLLKNATTGLCYQAASIATEARRVIGLNLCGKGLGFLSAYKEGSMENNRVEGCF